MKQHSADLEFDTPGEVHIRDLTPDIARIIEAAHIHLGQALVFTPSSTSAITTLEHEPGLLEDIPATLDRLFPRHGHGVDYGHERTWHDGNGHSHVRAALIGPDLTVPVRDGRLLLGTWQQIVFIELDNKPRRRRVAVHIWGTG